MKKPLCNIELPVLRLHRQTFTKCLEGQLLESLFIPTSVKFQVHFSNGEQQEQVPLTSTFMWIAVSNDNHPTW